MRADNLAKGFLVHEASEDLFILIHPFDKEGTEFDCFSSVDGNGYSSGALGIKDNMTPTLPVEDEVPTFQCADNLITGDP